MRIKPQYILEIKTATMKMKHVRKQKKFQKERKGYKVRNWSLLWDITDWKMNFDFCRFRIFKCVFSVTS